MYKCLTAGKHCKTIQNFSLYYNALAAVGQLKVKEYFRAVVLWLVCAYVVITS
jgi:hypothetical protein